MEWSVLIHRKSAHRYPIPGRFRENPYEGVKVDDDGTSQSMLRVRKPCRAVLLAISPRMIHCLLYPVELRWQRRWTSQYKWLPPEMKRELVFNETHWPGLYDRLCVVPGLKAVLMADYIFTLYLPFVKEKMCGRLSPRRSDSSTPR